MISEADLKAARRAYDMAIGEAEQARAATIAQAIDEGMPQKDVIKATGYSRETVRRITMLGNWYAGKQGAEPPGSGKRSKSIYDLGGLRPLGSAEQESTA